MKSRPTGIIRTLPWYGAEDSKHIDTEKGKAYRRLIRSFKVMEKRDTCLYVSLAQKPIIEVLHFYILIGGNIRVRANISHYVEGEKFGDVQCFDDTTRKAKWWAVLIGPVSWPPYDIVRRGFQGFRYTEELW